MSLTIDIHCNHCAGFICKKKVAGRKNDIEPKKNAYYCKNCKKYTIVETKADIPFGERLNYVMKG